MAPKILLGICVGASSTSFFTFFFFFYPPADGENKAQAHHTSMYFHTRRVSQQVLRCCVPGISQSTIGKIQRSIEKMAIPPIPQK